LLSRHPLARSARSFGGRQAIGVKDTEKNVINKIARGGFTAAFFLQCMEAIGVQNIHLNGD
jgi:hypothetical protein